MSDEKKEKKTVFIDVTDLRYEKEEYVEDLVVFLGEQLPYLELSQKTNEIKIEMQEDLSLRAIKLRLKKFLYKNDLKDDYRPISIRESDREGYIIKERKTFEYTYLY
ncbi:MAG: hypothetical protein EU541_02500 [Promethearchaeota archaeon]|nr:MAG: hypothetical protein EU541_02500 [Candidatus Lokiarchaeota archaeon]